MYSLVERGSRFSYYVLLILALPVLFETEFILTLWLKNYPEHTVNFIRLILIITMCDILSNTLINVQQATGKLKNYQIAVGGMLLMNFPFSYLCLKNGLPPESTLVVAILISLCCLLLRLIFLRTMVGLSIKHYLYKVCINVLCVTLVAAVIPFFIYVQMVDNVFRFIFICITAFVCSFTSIYFIGCTRNERKYILNFLVRKFF